MGSRFCLFFKLRISQKWNETPLSISSHQCTGVNTQSCSLFSWSCRVQTASSVSCGPPPSWPTTTPTTASPARRHRSTTWRKCRDVISPSPGKRAEIKDILVTSASTVTISWLRGTIMNKFSRELNTPSVVKCEITDSRITVSEQTWQMVQFTETVMKFH